MTHEFKVVLYDDKEPVSVVAHEMDIVDGNLVFMGINRGGYIAAYAAGMWVAVLPQQEKDF